MIKNDKFDYFILKKQYQSFGYGHIIDNEGNITVKILFPLYHTHHLVELQDLKSNSVFFIQRSLSLFHMKYILTNSSNEIIATIKVRKQPLKNRASLETKKVPKKYIASGNLKRWSYKIIDKFDKTIIAYVCELKNSDMTPKNISEISKYYFIKISSKESPIALISFAVAINNLGYHGIANISGIERRIARLRPFGPRKIK